MTVVVVFAVGPMNVVMIMIMLAVRPVDMLVVTLLVVFGEVDSGEPVDVLGGGE